MYILVDVENVSNVGLRGSEYLLASDHVILFYSDAASHLEARYLEDIRNSGCGFEICSLVRGRKNALDFYIATRLGEIFGGGERGPALIVSRDDGFQSLRDYWSARAEPSRRVLVSENIERGIVSLNLPDQRTALIRQRMKSTDISAFHAACEERGRLRRMLEKSFAGTEFSGRTEEIEAFLNLKKESGPKVIYLDALRRFGRKNGLEVYRRLKSSGEL